MPIYGYKCDKCNHEFEVEQKIGDSKKKKCPKCNEMSLKRIFYPVGVHFKGKGFHVTDYGSGKSLPTKSDKKKDAIKDGGKTSKDAIKRKE